jgi:hypothetical protein
LLGEFELFIKESSVCMGGPIVLVVIEGSLRGGESTGISTDIIDEGPLSEFEVTRVRGLGDLGKADEFGPGDAAPRSTLEEGRLIPGRFLLIRKSAMDLLYSFSPSS